MSSVWEQCCGVRAGHAVTPRTRKLMVERAQNAGDNENSSSNTNNNRQYDTVVQMWGSVKDKVKDGVWKTGLFQSSNPLYQRLLDAVKNNNAAAVMQALGRDSSVDVNHPDSSGNTPIMSAAVVGHNDALRALLERSANPNLHHEGSGDTALTMAASTNNFEAVRMLLSFGADPNARNRIMFSALMCSCLMGHVQSVVALVEHPRTDLNLQLPFGDTALHLAVYGCHVTVVETLIRFNANVNVKNQIGATPLIMTVSVPRRIFDENKQKIAKAFIDCQRTNTEETNLLGQTALVCATHHGHKQIVEMLINRGAVLTASDSSGRTGLHISCETGNHQMLRLFLDAAAPHLPDKKGQTPLMLACANGHVTCMELLLAADVDALAKDSEGYTSLMHSSGIGHTKAVQMLLSHPQARDSLNSKSNDGTTAIMLAVNSGCVEVVRDLIAYGAEIDATNKHGQCCVVSAAFLGHTAIMEDLLARGANADIKYTTQCWTPLSLAVSKGHVDTARVLIEKGRVDVNAANIHNETALMIASEMGNSEMVSLLLRAGAKTEIVNSQGLSAFQLARKNGHRVVVGMLKINGAPTGKETQECIVS